VTDGVGHEELMRYLDGEVTPEERVRIEAEIGESTELQREVALYRKMKEDLQTLRFETKRTRSIWYSVHRHLTRPFGWGFLVAGIVLWAGYGSYLYAVSAIDPIKKLATAAIVLGVLLLLGSVVYERYRERLTDPYRDVVR
jgi:hypothetical protein